VRLGTPAGVLREIALESRIFGAEDCLARGLVDELVEPAALLDRAVACAEEPRRAARDRVRDHEAPAARRPATERLERDGFRGPELLDAWASDEGLGAIRAYVDPHPAEVTHRKEIRP
jgi:enoyl-CoA hydratase/carnithine racemase